MTSDSHKCVLLGHSVSGRWKAGQEIRSMCYVYIPGPVNREVWRAHLAASPSHHHECVYLHADTVRGCVVGGSIDILFVKQWRLLCSTPSEAESKHQLLWPLRFWLAWLSASCDSPVFTKHGKTATIARGLWVMSPRCISRCFCCTTDMPFSCRFSCYIFILWDRIMTG